jgi:hypothetical protein
MPLRPTVFRAAASGGEGAAPRLDRLQEAEIDKAGRRMTLCTPCTGAAGPLFKATPIALPANIQDPSAC